MQRLPLNFKLSHETHRGYAIGYEPVPHRGWCTPWWKKEGDLEWRRGSVPGVDPGDAVRCAKECIDFQIKIEAEEARLGHKLSLGGIRQLAERDRKASATATA